MSGAARPGGAGAPAPGAGAPFADAVEHPPVLHREQVFDGMVWNVVRERVDLGAGGTVTREFVDHPGAVTVLAMDAQERVLLLRQYRHPVRMRLVEAPAGLLDVAGEPALAGAKRELFEEADLVADTWNLLIDWFNSPGGSNEAIRCYLARDVREVPEAQRHQRHEEELDMHTTWMPLDDAVDLVLSGGVHNPGAVVSVLAAARLRDRGWQGLRPAEEPWPLHPRLRP